MKNGFEDNDQFDPSNEDDWQTFINSLHTTQLKTLNSLICDRMDYLQSMDSLDKMIQFKMDEHVQFTDKKGQLHTGQITKFNRKTISVMSAEGKKWNVSPQILEGIVNPTLQASTHPTNQPGKMRPNDWVAGCAPLPGSVNSEEGYYVPDIVIWVDGEGMVRHIGVLEPGNEAQEMVQSFEIAIKGPDGDWTQPPETLRTDNANLKRLLEPLFQDTTIFLANVPEIVEVAEHMTESMRNDTPVTRTYQDRDICPSTVAAFFDATAHLYSAQPWNLIPQEERLLGITIDKFDVKNNVITVIGQAGMSYAVLLFECLADYERYSAIVNTDDPKRFEEMPNHRVLNYIPATELEAEQRKEIMDNGWQVAGHNAYPDLFIPVSGRVARYADTRDLGLFETISSALIGLLKNHAALENCWQSGEPLSFDQQITTSDGVVDVVIQLPVLPPGKTLETLNALERMALIDRSDFADADQLHYDLKTQIDKAYRSSPEARSLDEAGAGFTLVMEFAFNYLECTVATILPKDLQEVLFEIIPRKVMINATEADDIIDDCVAFFSFLKREYSMQNADEHLAILDASARQTLREALNDASKFGMGKSIFSGSNMSSGTPGGGIDLPANDGDFIFPHELGFGDELLHVKPPKALSSNEKKSRKKNRKASRKARKKGK